MNFCKNFIKQLLTLNLFILIAPLYAQDAEEEEVLPGFELLSDHVLVETPDHWRTWDAPTGARRIQTDGTVTPRLLRSHVNAVFSAENDSILARVITPTNSRRKFSEALWSLMGRASPTATAAASAISPSLNRSPLKIFSAFLARIGVGATAPNTTRTS